MTRRCRAAPRALQSRAAKGVTFFGINEVAIEIEDPDTSWTLSYSAKEHRDARVCLANWVLGRQIDWLRQWAYTDGTTFYIARSEPEKTSSGRMALGAFVWRMADGSDGLYEDCIGLLRNFHRDSRRQVGGPQV